MRHIALIFAVLLLAASAAGQASTVVTDTARDLTGEVVPAGQVTFELRPPGPSTISGIGTFSATTTACTINQSQFGTSAGQITSLVRSSNSVTATFNGSQPFIVGDVLSLGGWSDSTFNGTSVFTVTAVTTGASPTVTWAQTASNSSATGGYISALRSTPGPGSCIVTQNTALTPKGTYYKVTVWPSFSPTASFNFYALANSVDLSAVVPTPGQEPGFSFVDLFSNQTISGVKTFTNPASNIPFKPDPSIAVQYVAATCAGGSPCADTNDGITWASAKLTNAAACAALPSGNSSCSAGSGTVFISPGFSGTILSSGISSVSIVHWNGALLGNVALLNLANSWTGLQSFNAGITGTGNIGSLDLGSGALGAAHTWTANQIFPAAGLFFSTSNAVNFSVTNPAAARTYTIPDFGSNDSFVGLAATQTESGKTLTSPVINGSVSGTAIEGTGPQLPSAGTLGASLPTCTDANKTLQTSGCAAGATDFTIAPGVSEAGNNPVCSGATTGCAVYIFPNAHKIVRLVAAVTTAPSGCTTNAKLGVQDVTGSSTLTSLTPTSLGILDSGALSVSTTAGHTIGIGVVTQDSGCATHLVATVTATLE